MASSDICKNVGYYSLSGNWHIHKKRGSDEFWEGTHVQARMGHIAGDLGVSTKVLDSWFVTINTVRKW